ncbi:MAG TPA: glutaredoxin family protein [Terriglobia bacterium]|jgi:mycoredoxin|nr:glutaredoxin family protein [Terriglobia bacterium]
MQLPNDHSQTCATAVASLDRRGRKIRMYTTSWCSDCWRAKQFLNRHGVEFEEINIEEAPEAVEFVMSVNGGKRRVPTFDFEGRVFSSSPFDPALLKRELGIE